MTTTKNNEKKDLFGLNTDFSHIDSSADLEQEIRKMKTLLRLQKKSLQEDLTHIPAEAVKATVGNILPFVLKAKVADQTWNIVKTAFSFLNANPFKKDHSGNSANTLLNVAKQVGTFAAIKGIKSWFQRKKKNPATSSIAED